MAAAIVALACGCVEEIDDKWGIVGVKLCKSHVEILTWLDLRYVHLTEPEPPAPGVSVREVTRTSEG